MERLIEPSDDSESHALEAIYLDSEESYDDDPLFL